MGHGHNQHAYCVKTRKDIIGNRIVSTCRKDTIGKTQYALLCLFGAYCVFSRFPWSSPHPMWSSHRPRAEERECLFYADTRHQRIWGNDRRQHSRWGVCITVLVCTVKPPSILTSRYNSRSVTARTNRLVCVSASHWFCRPSMILRTSKSQVVELFLCVRFKTQTQKCQAKWGS